MSDSIPDSKISEGNIYLPPLIYSNTNVDPMSGLFTVSNRASFISFLFLSVHPDLALNWLLVYYEEISVYSAL